jgi:HAD superfamily hydrolase (TIGR01549 family)/HAD superfamily hydrolase (TIGR01509 family)
MTIQAVFFDMGGTIQNFWYTQESRLAATPGLQRLMLSYGIDLDLDINTFYRVVSEGLNKYHYWALQNLTELAPTRVWNEFVLFDLNLDHVLSDEQAENLMHFIESYYYHREMRPEIPQVLEIIKKMGLKIGLISNVCSRSQVPDDLDTYGIRDYFDPIVLSSVYGRRKPDPAIFHYAARLAGVPTSACVHVGDRISRDIIGANKAGYQMAIQIHHQFNSDDDESGSIPDKQIDNMFELIDILRKTRDNDNKTEYPKIRALVFDAGDILYYRPNRGVRFKKFLDENNLTPVENHTVEISQITQQAFIGKIDQDTFRSSILRLFGLNQPELIKRGKQILEDEDNDVVFFAGVKETLQALKETGFLLGIVTDTANPIHVKLSWFERGGFGQVWDSIISSMEIGIRKPSPIIYNAALEQLGTKADQTVFIGHKASELEGARAVGMKTIAFNYDDNAKADFFIKKFSDLMQVPFLR